MKSGIERQQASKSSTTARYHLLPTTEETPTEGGNKTAAKDSDEDNGLLSVVRSPNSGYLKAQPLREPNTLRIDGGGRKKVTYGLFGHLNATMSILGGAEQMLTARLDSNGRPVFDIHRPSVKLDWKERVKLVLPHVILVVSTIVYTLFGGVFFYSIERPHERQTKVEKANRVRQMQLKFLENAWEWGQKSSDNNFSLNPNATNFEKDLWYTKVEEELDAVLEATFDAFSGRVTVEEIGSDGTTVYLNWNLASAIFFSATVITTIGYGHLVPATPLGRLLCIVYAFLGIPLALVTIADLGKFVGRIITDIYRSLKRLKTRLLSCFNRTTDYGAYNAVIGDSFSTTKVSGYFVLFVLLAYMALSAASFTVWEDGWSFLDSFYFCFITMVTVGFGDLVPKKDAYVAVSILFIFGGLVLTTMCVDVVGGDYIERIHYFGRQMKFAKTALALLGDKSQGWLRHITHKHRQQDNNRLVFLAPEYAGYVHGDGEGVDGGGMWFAYCPPDADVISYIDVASVHRRTVPQPYDSDDDRRPPIVNLAEDDTFHI